MPEPITVGEAYDDILALDDLFAKLAELVAAVIDDGRYLPEHMRVPLGGALPEALESMTELRFALREMLYVLPQAPTRRAGQPRRPPARVRRGGAPRPDLAAVPLVPRDELDVSQLWTEIDERAQLLVDRGLVGPQGRVKVKAFLKHYWGLGRKHGRRWTRKALAIGSIPLNSFATGTLVGKGITEFVDLVGELIPED